MCKGTHKHLAFLKYKINVRILFQSVREIAIQRNELQNFLEAWAQFKKLLHANLSQCLHQHKSKMTLVNKNMY